LFYIWTGQICLRYLKIQFTLLLFLLLLGVLRVWGGNKVDVCWLSAGGGTGAVWLTILWRVFTFANLVFILRSQDLLFRKLEKKTVFIRTCILFFLSLNWSFWTGLRIILHFTLDNHSSAWRALSVQWSHALRVILALHFLSFTSWPTYSFLV